MNFKTPLRYPGGKSRALKYLKPKMPEDYSSFVEPFVGGGSVFLSTKKDKPEGDYWINDLYFNLYCFWVALRDQPDNLVDSLQTIKNRSRELITKSQIKEMDLPKQDRLLLTKRITKNAKEMFLETKDRIKTTTSDLDRAVCFFILNKCSFSGLTESGTFSAQASMQNFSDNSIQRLSEVSKAIQGVRITNMDYVDVLKDLPSNSFLFFDPPYDILKGKEKKTNALYGKSGKMHIGFDHELFANQCDTIREDHKFMITYNNNEQIRNRFSKYNQTLWDLTYTMRSTGEYMKDQKERKELLITNYDF
tara:strand:+ start:13389 stop:14306 length:918 start_codon:yes stop_codon:yes gene_type:complete